MKSMTGCGWAEARDADISASVEIKGYNGRFLDISVNLPPFLSQLETNIREYLGTLCRRGSIETWIRCREINPPLAVSVNREAARAYYDAALSLSRELGLSETPPLAFILEQEGVLEQEKSRSAERAWEYIRPLLEKAAALFDAERTREGAHTQADISSYLSQLEKSLELLVSLSSILDEKLKTAVKTRFAELLGDAVDENRVLAETAALLVKYTVSEEISRLASHLGEFRNILHQNHDSQAPGKKLDFLCQEINREINTVGSKAAMLEVSREVVDMKNALENIREQLRNVE